MACIDQALDHADEQRGRRRGIDLRRNLAPRLALFDQRSAGAHRSGACRSCTTRFAGVLSARCNSPNTMRGTPGCSATNSMCAMNTASNASNGDSAARAARSAAGKQPLAHPSDHGFPDRVLGRKVSEQRALGQIHVLGDRGRRDLAGIAFASQRDNGLDREGATFVGG